MLSNYFIVNCSDESVNLSLSLSLSLSLLS